MIVFMENIMTDNKEITNNETMVSAEKLDLTFEQAAAELDAIVNELSSGNVQLDEMIALFERGNLLSEHCGALLDEYDGRISNALRDKTEVGQQ